MIGTATPSAPMSDQSPTELSAPIVSLFGVEIVAVNDVSVPEVYPAGEGQRAVECNLDGKFLAPGEIEGEWVRSDSESCEKMGSLLGGVTSIELDCVGQDEAVLERFGPWVGGEIAGEQYEA